MENKLRKTKRFTPALFDRFEKLGRGSGIYQHYLPFHRVGRSDPSSRGRSHIELWRNRHREFLSDGELIAFLFSAMLPQIVDIREQFPLGYEDCNHELREFDISIDNDYFLGTKNICEKLGVRHPRVNGNGESAPWRMTTDLLLTLKDQNEKLYLLAISCKDKNFILQNRGKTLQEIERNYWHNRGVNWLLIKPETYDHTASLTLRCSRSWGLGETVPNDVLKFVAIELHKCVGTSLTNTIKHLSLKLNDYELAQRAFWQCVWTGIFPLDLRRGWRPHLPINILSVKEFWMLNPIASRRTAWK